MTLLYIVLATAAGGILSVIVAASLTVSLLSRVVKSLVSLSAGVLLATALLNILPEAFEGHASPQSLFATLLAVGLLQNIHLRTGATDGRVFANPRVLVGR